MRITFEAEDWQDIIDSIVDQLDPDEAIQVIKDIDKTFADYDFTLKLRDYFVEQIAAEEESANERDRQRRDDGI